MREPISQHTVKKAAEIMRGINWPFVFAFEYPSEDKRRVKWPIDTRSGDSQNTFQMSILRIREIFENLGLKFIVREERP